MDKKRIQIHEETRKKTKRLKLLHNFTIQSKCIHELDFFIRISALV